MPLYQFRSKCCPEEPRFNTLSEAGKHLRNVHNIHDLDRLDNLLEIVEASPPDQSSEYAQPQSPPTPTGLLADKALRYDTNKLRYDLIPQDALAEYVKVLTLGAAKYADRNWEKGMSWSRCFASLQRHSAAWMQGEDCDPELGTDHMAHVAWNALALVAYRLRQIGKDDRPNSDNAKRD